MFLYLRRRRVLSACFVYLLAPEKFREAVAELRTVRGGLERWIVPALERTQADLLALKVPGHPGNELVKIIPELLKSCRELPVAESWRRKRGAAQRQWADHLRKHPEDMAKVKAPWMLPEGFTLDHQPGSGRGQEANPSSRPRR